MVRRLSPAGVTQRRSARLRSVLLERSSWPKTSHPKSSMYTCDAPRRQRCPFRLAWQ